MFIAARFSLSSDYPAEPLTLPVEVGLRESPGQNRSGFNEAEGPYRWLQKHAAIRFRLSPELLAYVVFSHRAHRLAYPGRPTQTRREWSHSWNTYQKACPTLPSFVVPREAIHAGAVNRSLSNTEKAGPVGADTARDRLRLCESGSSCGGPGRELRVRSGWLSPTYYSIGADWAPSCYGLDGTPPGQWRWCGPDSLIVDPQLFFKAQTPDSECRFFHRSRQRLPSSRFVLHFSMIPWPSAAIGWLTPGHLRLRQATHTIVFTCLAPRSSIGRDSRNLVLRFENFRLGSIP
jgi:hypothetical protein